MRLTELTASSTAVTAMLGAPLLPMSRLESPSVLANVSEVLSWIVSIPAWTPVPTWNVIVEPVPSSNGTPLNVVDNAMRSISLIRSPNSCCRVSRSSLLTVPLDAWMASSRIRIRMLLTSFSAPSPVCVSEMPSWALRIAWLVDRICARKRSEIAKPAASSAAVEMRKPVDSRRKLACRRSVVTDSERWALIDAMLELTRRPISSPRFLCPDSGGSCASLPRQAHRLSLEHYFRNSSNRTPGQPAPVARGLAGPQNAVIPRSGQALSWRPTVAVLK